MKIGTVCYATNSGLGILAKAFHAHGIITDVCVIRHGKHKTHDSWYPGALQISDLRDLHQRQMMASFALGMDAMLFFETPFDWTLIDRCKQKGVKTYLMLMYECAPENLPARPDIFLCPSLLDMEVFGNFTREKVKSVIQFEYYSGGMYFTPVPVEVPWRQRTKANVFVHNAGHGGLKGRNGTAELLDAIPLLKSDAKILIRSQKPLECKLRDSLQNVVITHGRTFPYEQMFLDGDVFVFPEKFNGLSLPLQEARAAGMLVMGTDRFPMNEWLPQALETTTEDNKVIRTFKPVLIRSDDYRRSRIGPPYNEFDEAIINPRDIAERIDDLYGADISAYSLSGREWAESMSWELLGPKYKELLRP